MQQYYTPLSIVFAAIVIAGSLWFTSSAPAAIPLGATSDQTNEQVTPEPERPPVAPQRTENRRVYGNPEASVTVVEFSDYECPFCARVHPTLERLVDESEGMVNWEYRHLPLVIHPEARPSAIAAECVGDLAGNDAFWEYSSFLFANQRALGTTIYENGARSLGIDIAAFNSCRESPEMAERVLQDERIAATLGGSGTPFNVIIYEDGTTRSVPGALPYNQFKALVSR